MVEGSVLKMKVREYLKEKVNKKNERLRFEVKEVCKDDVIVEVLEPAHHQKRIPMRRFLHFLESK